MLALSLQRVLGNTVRRILEAMHCSEGIRLGAYCAAVMGRGLIPDSLEELETVLPEMRRLLRSGTAARRGHSLVALTKAIAQGSDMLRTRKVAEIADFRRTLVPLSTAERKGVLLAANAIIAATGLQMALQMDDDEAPGKYNSVDTLFAAEFGEIDPSVASVLRHLGRGRTIKADYSMPMFAQLYWRLLRMPLDPPITELVDLAESDAVLASLLLRAANSVAYGGRYAVTGVRQAVLCLGVPLSRKVLQSACMLRMCVSKPLKEIWTHSQRVATECYRLASVTGVDVESAYSCGLIHDIGRFALETAPAESKLCEADWRAMGYPILDAEILSYPEDHTVLGARIAREWGLPEVFAVAIAYHHKPEMSGEILSAIVYLADKKDGEQREEFYPAQRTAAALEIVGEPSEAVQPEELLVLERLAS